MSKKKLLILLLVCGFFLNFIIYLSHPNFIEREVPDGDIIEKDVINVKRAAAQSVSPKEIGNYSDGGHYFDVYVSGGIAYLADYDQGLEIINVSDPSNPTLLGKYGDSDNHTRSVYVTNGIAYVADGLDGLNIINVTDPTNPTLLSKYRDNFFSGWNYGYWNLQVSGGIAYVTLYYAAASPAPYAPYGSLEIINVSDPTNPTFLGRYGDDYNRSYDLSLYGNIAYLADDQDGLEIIDVSDPTNPIELGQYHHHRTDGSQASGIEISDNIAYMACGEYGFETVDVSNPANPKKLDHLNDGGNSWNVIISGGIAYVADADLGLKIIDISDPANVTKIGQFNDIGDEVDLFISGDIAYIADEFEGLEIIDIGFESGKWLTPTELGTLDLYPGYSSGIFVSGDYAFVADVTDGLDIINVQDPTNPSFQGHFPTSNPREIFVSGDVAYVADRDDGLLIINVTSKSDPQLLGTYNDGYTNSSDVFVSGNIAYVADRDDGFELINVSNPNNPKKVGHYNTGARAIYVSGNVAYVAGGSDGLEIYDVSNPSNPYPLGSYDTNGIAYDVYVSGDIAYIADGYEGLVIIDVSDLTNPIKLGFLNGYGQAVNVYVSGNIAYIADIYDGLEIVNVMDPSKPKKISEFDYGLVMLASGIYLSGNIAYVAAGNIDLGIIDTGYDGDDDGLTNARELIIYHTNLSNPDTDNDNLSDGDEINIYNTDPKNPDSDYDNILDGEEVVPGLDGFITDPNNNDSDNDLMPDSWEVINYLNPVFDDAMDDADSDNLSNVDEYFTNTDPNDDDSDNDVMLDGWEVLYGLNPLIDDSDGDPDLDGLSNLEEYNIGTFPDDSDSDNDNLSDSEEINLYGTDPTNRDTDGDGYNDGEELSAGTDPLNPQVFPGSSLNIFFIILIVSIISVSGSVSLTLYLRMKGVIGKRPGINIFISHKIDEFEKYKIEQLAKQLEKNKDIYKVFFSEKEIRGDIDDWMENNVPLCQILLYMATKKSLESVGCQYEIQLALENDIEIIPIVGDDIEFHDLKKLNNLQLDLHEKKINFSKLNLHRKLGLAYSLDFEIFFQNLMEALNKFLEPLIKVLLKLKESSVSNVNLLEKKLGFNEKDIIKNIKILIKVNKIKGALTADHTQFLKKKEVKRRIDMTKSQGRYEDINELITDAGIDKDSIENVKLILGKHYV